MTLHKSNSTLKPVSSQVSSCLVYEPPTAHSFMFISDLSHLFDWNTKQLFVMLIAHYTTPKNVSFPTPLVLGLEVILRGDSLVVGNQSSCTMGQDYPTW